MTFPKLGVCDRSLVNEKNVSLFERIEGGQLKVHLLNILTGVGVPEVEARGHPYIAT